jgi:hypothetical protein
MHPSEAKLEPNKYEDKGLNTMYTLWKSLEIKGFLGTGGMHWYQIIGAKVIGRKRTIDILGIGRVSMISGKSVYSTVGRMSVVSR